MGTVELAINPTFKAELPALSEEERKLLRENIVEDGRIREAIIYWRDGDNNWIVDGMNRFELATELGLPYKSEERKFGSELEALCWMHRNQCGRRNQTPERMRYSRGKCYLHTKELPQPGMEVNAAKVVAEQTGVNERTVRRDGEYAAILDGLFQPLRDAILTKQMPANEQVIRALAKFPIGEQHQIMRDVRVGQFKTLKERLQKEGVKFSSDKWMATRAATKGAKKPKKPKPPKAKAPPLTKQEKAIAKEVEEIRNRVSGEQLVCPCCDGKGWIRRQAELPPKLAASDDFVRAFATYRADRKQRRIKPMGPIGEAKLLNQLLEWGVAKAIRALEQCVEKGWQGVFDPDKGAGNGHKPEAPKGIKYHE